MPALSRVIAVRILSGCCADALGGPLTYCISERVGARRAAQASGRTCALTSIHGLYTSTETANLQSVCAARRRLQWARARGALLPARCRCEHSGLGQAEIAQGLRLRGSLHMYDTFTGCLTHTHTYIDAHTHARTCAYTHIRNMQGLCGSLCIACRRRRCGPGW